MRGWIMIVGTSIGLFAVCWYAATGETGPMGWLNSWQNSNTGSYSRVLSFFILCVAFSAVTGPVLGAWAVIGRKTSARTVVSKESFTAAADAKTAAMLVAVSDRSRWRGWMYFKVWLVGVALICAAVMGWHSWDFHRRSSDANDDYTPLRLSRTTPLVHVDNGSHWALQGRLLWDRSAMQTAKTSVRVTETLFVPFAGADWRPGDAVEFVVRMPKTEAWGLQRRADGTDGADVPLRVRVEGAVPTPSRAVFQKAAAPLADTAVLVEVVNASAGPAIEAKPTFDWNNAGIISLAISGTWTAGIWLGALGVLVQVWRQRRLRAK